MRTGNICAWTVGIFFGVLAIVLGLKMAFTLSRGKGWRLKAFVIAVSLATLWWPGFVSRLCAQDKPPQGAEQPAEKSKLKDSTEWKDMIAYWEEISTLDFDQKSGKELEALAERGVKLAKALEPLESDGGLAAGAAAEIAKDAKDRCRVRPNDVMCYDMKAVEKRQVTWKSVAQQVAAIVRQRREGKIEPWTCVKLVMQVRNDLAMLEGKLPAGHELGEVSKEQPAVHPEIAKYLKDRISKLVATLESNGQLAATDEKPPDLTPELKERVTALITKLGHDDFDTREKAQSDLIEIGEPALGQLREALKSEDAEVRMRAKAVLEAFGEQTE
jgi:hypothetical protein